MKKITVFLVALCLIVCMTVPVFAVTPPLNAPDMPEIPEIKVNFKLPDGFWDKWFAGHPIRLPDDFEIQEPTEATEPEVIVLGVPAITEARYYHRGIKRLQIRWDAVDGAESYEVEVTKADGTIDVYTTNSAMLFLKNVECPKVYIEETRTCAAASVKVRAVCGDSVGDWSEAKKVGCDMRH